jgi:predicted membrane-bound spermidine synthase
MAVYRETDGDIVREYALQEGMPVFTKQTKRAFLDIVSTKAYGTTLFLDNELQFAEKDEYIYHEMLVHPCLLASQSRKNICIIGGGDGCAAREILKWGNEVDSIDIIDWDSEVTTMFTKEYKWINSESLNNQKVNIENVNIRECLHEERSYDCILIDLLDPNLEEPYQLDLWYDCLFLAKQWLKEGGSMIINAGGMTSWDTKSVVSFFDLAQRRLHYPLFLSKVFVPSFGRDWCFVQNFTSEDLDFDRLPNNLRYMSKEAWNSAFFTGWAPDYRRCFRLNTMN